MDLLQELIGRDLDTHDQVDEAEKVQNCQEYRVQVRIVDAENNAEGCNSKQT